MKQRAFFSNGGSNILTEVFYNGAIITMEEENCGESTNNEPEAVCVKDGVIVGVGSLDDIKKIAGSKAIFTNLEGKCLMPSFVDSHSHITMNGQMAMLARLGDCTSYDDIINVLKKYIADNKIGPNGAVLGFGYDHNFLKEKRQPDKKVLDKVSTEIPIMILHVSAHLACVNSKALELAGITSETIDPEGGVIGRLDNSSEPSGYLEENGMSEVRGIISKRIKPDIKAMIKGMQDDYISHGITTAQDGATTKSDLTILKIMSLLGMLKLDVVAYPLMTSGGEKLLHKNRVHVKKYKRRLKIGGYKLVLDGSPQGRSAWMTEPYLGSKPDYCGYPWMSDEQVEKYAKVAVSEGQQLLAHCNGDAASEQFLNAYEKAIEQIPSREELRPVMIHCQTVRNDQLERMTKIGMIASIFVGHVFYWGDIHKINFGDKRGNHISPVRDAIDMGVHVNFHQDTPVTAPDVMHSVWAAVNRVSREGTVVGEDQKVSVYEALRAVTIEGAYQYFEEDSKGSIKVGKRADLVVLSQSPVEVPKESIKDIKVLRTIKDGRTIYIV